MIPVRDLAQEFIQGLARDLNEGYHIVPFIGAGFSLGAGYPTTTVLAENLLPYWIIRGLGLNPFAVLDEPVQGATSRIVDPRLRQWSPADGWWPLAGEELLASDSQNVLPFSATKAVKLLDILLKEDVERSGVTELELPATFDTLERAMVVIEKGDWMSMLQFLSRLSRTTADQPQITCGPERQSVVDSLFLHLNKQCQPALAHEMLAALRNIWRCRVILTTNFDTLIEGAFSNAREPLETFEVGKTSPLPDCNLVLAQPSLVKLHGGRFDVRVDVTVGSPLAREDIKNAMSYVAGRNLFREDTLVSPAAENDKVALVFIGCGDSDERTMSFAQYVSQHFKNFAKVYWVSYTEKRPGQIKTIRSFIKNRKFAVHYSDFGLLLLSLYEHLTGSIPPNGAINPSPWLLASPPRIPKQDDKTVDSDLNKARVKLRDELFIHDESRYRPGELAKRQGPLRPGEGEFDRLVYFRPKENCKPIWLRLTEANYAAAAICLAFFEKARDYGFKGLWVDLDEVTMPAGVLIRIAMMIHRMEGVIDPLTTLGVDALASPEKAEAACQTIKDTLMRHYADSGVPLITFLNASEAPGTEALFRLPSEELLVADRNNRCNRWYGPNAKDETDRLMDILVELVNTPSCGIKFVIAAPEDRVEDNKHPAAVFDTALSGRLTANEIHELRIAEQCTAFDPKRISQIAVDWVETGVLPDMQPIMRSWDDPTPISVSEPTALGGSNLDGGSIRAVFLAVLVKFRQSRYPSSLARIVHSYCLEVHGRGGLDGSEIEIRKLVQDWLAKLERNRVLRRRDGGFVWMNNRVQRTLRDNYKDWMKGINCQIIHGCIARWHARLLFSCSDPLSATEGIFHHLRGIRSMLKDIQAALRTERPLPVTSDAGLWEDAHAMIDHAELLLNTSRVLFERRIATTFSDRSFQFLIEEVGELTNELQQFEDRFAEDSQSLQPAPNAGSSSAAVVVQ